MDVVVFFSCLLRPARARLLPRRLGLGPRVGGKLHRLRASPCRVGLSTRPARVYIPFLAIYQNTLYQWRVRGGGGGRWPRHREGGGTGVATLATCVGISSSTPREATALSLEFSARTREAHGAVRR